MVEAQAAAIGDVPWGGASPGQGGSPGFARGDEAGNQPCRGQCRERGPCPACPPQVGADNVTGSQFISVTFQFISGSVPKTPVGKFRKRGSARGKRNVLDLEPVAEKPALFTDDLVPRPHAHPRSRLCQEDRKINPVRNNHCNSCERRHLHREFNIIFLPKIEPFCVGAVTAYWCYSRPEGVRSRLEPLPTSYPSES